MHLTLKTIHFDHKKEWILPQNNLVDNHIKETHEICIYDKDMYLYTDIYTYTTIKEAL